MNIAHNVSTLPNSSTN